MAFIRCRLGQRRYAPVKSASGGNVETVATDYSPRLGRIPIRFLTPQQPENRWPSKAYRGEVVPFGATVFREGHDLIGVRLLLTDPAGVETSHRMRMAAPGTDRWQALAALHTEGEWLLVELQGAWRITETRPTWPAVPSPRWCSASTMCLRATRRSGT